MNREVHVERMIILRIYQYVWKIAILRLTSLALLMGAETVHLDMEQLHVVLMDVMDRFKSHVLQMDVEIVHQHTIQNLALL